MRKGVKALSVLLLLCVLFGFTACGDKDKFVGKWKQFSYNSGYSKLKDEYGQLEFEKNGTYKRVSSTDHVGFSSSISAESGRYEVDDKEGHLLLYPDDGSYGKTVYTFTYSVSSDELTIRSLDGSDIVKFKR
ncbi:hypothetical protein B0O40_0730 [Ruminococcaceae bacterium R-25]|nr:hypothetical protein B0O40_0730 [Ruminococcaceae bacterium R-25]SUQ11358.1 hypothetical protein SAMN06297423_0730 [Oscillospiraceae bacterium]